MTSNYLGVYLDRNNDRHRVYQRVTGVAVDATPILSNVFDVVDESGRCFVFVGLPGELRAEQ